MITIYINMDYMFLLLLVLLKASIIKRLIIFIKNYLLQYKKPILLQVSGSNENALHIYKKLGFKTASQVNYYSIDII